MTDISSVCVSLDIQYALVDSLSQINSYRPLYMAKATGFVSPSPSAGFVSFVFPSLVYLLQTS